MPRSLRRYRACRPGRRLRRGCQRLAWRAARRGRSCAPQGVPRRRDRSAAGRRRIEPDHAPPGLDRRCARWSRSRLRVTGRRTNARGSPRPVSPSRAGQGWQAVGAGQVSAATAALCPLARWPSGCGVVAWPCRCRADRSRCRSQRSGPARWEGQPTAETAPRATGPRELRRRPPRRHAFCQRT
jgi:hypothetical protein